MTTTVAENPLLKERAEAHEQAKAILDGAKAAGGDLSPEDAERVRSLIEQVKGFDVKLKSQRESSELQRAIDQLVPDASKALAHPGWQLDPGRAPARSLGEHFLKHAGQRLQEIKGVSGATATAPEWVPAGRKAADDVQVTGGPDGPYRDWLTDVDRSLQRQKRERPVVADLIGSGSISGQAIRYYLEGSIEGDFATVPEGGRKPQMHLTEPTPVTDHVTKVAAFIHLTDETLEDLPLVQSEIDNRLLYTLSVFEERQLLYGTGQGTDLTGILNRSGLQNEQSANAGDDADSIFRAMTKIATATNYKADGLVIHPLDYQKFRLSRDGNGQYLAGGYFTGQYGQGPVLTDPPLWGLRTIVTPVVAQGKPLVGNFAQGATLYRKGGIRVESTNSDQDDFVYNRVKIRAETRLALAVRCPLAFAKIFLAN
ncbi:putative phage capsid protein [Segniliparus rotundus DSM 44985]|uniref:Putative phage capsid protein n=1 Tax=Segniliparus rotundus (strain ATCC BAA-972 / CDC 1076 / CIP 108378 / DSM 44985 / JCM 13578) TaxID=640132 RepID=D6ZFB2_SEGRD|nr:phage major capsid protein [Segniliparus rotundus]ADG97636.1 putative phage capsid protein [Segniliparus rotundus DSM 44985]